MDLTDMTYIYSILNFISKWAKFLHIPTPVVTFDQPLWSKATEIVNKMQMNIVSLLVGFYTAMSFTGTMGAIMSGSGLQNAFETILGKKTQ